MYHDDELVGWQNLAWEKFEYSNKKDISPMDMCSRGGGSDFSTKSFVKVGKDGKADLEDSFLDNEEKQKKLAQERIREKQRKRFFEKLKTKEKESTESESDDETHSDDNDTALENVSGSDEKVNDYYVNQTGFNGTGKNTTDTESSPEVIKTNEDTTKNDPAKNTSNQDNNIPQVEC